MRVWKDFSKSSSVRNFYVDIITAVPFVLLLSTGIIMLLYHTGKPYISETFGLTGTAWLTIHQILTALGAPLVLIHLLLHLDWLKKLFTGKLKKAHRGKNATLLIFFLLTMLTSVFSWLVFSDGAIAQGLRGVHNKFGLVLFVFFIIHLAVYFKWLAAMVKKTAQIDCYIISRYSHFYLRKINSDFFRTSAFNKKERLPGIIRFIPNYSFVNCCLRIIVLFRIAAEKV